MKSPSKPRGDPGPTFVARFADDVVARMTTSCSPKQLDVKRGVALANAAYESRTKKQPPPIVEAKFVLPGFDDQELSHYDQAELQKALEEPVP